MGKNEFDTDFDFEKEYGFNPDDFLNSEDPSDLDLSAFDEELGMNQDQQPQAEEDFSDFDLSSLDLEDKPFSEEEPLPGEPDGEPDMEADLDFEEDLNLDLDDEAEPEDQLDFPGEPDFTPEETPRQSRRNPEPVRERRRNPEPEDDDDDDDDIGDDAEDDGEDAESKAPRNVRRRKPAKPARPPKPKKPSVFSKLLDLYIAPVLDKNARAGIIPEPSDPNAPRPRRRRKSKTQVFKEVYLPPLIACVALILVLTFIIGSIVNAVERKQINDENSRKESQSAASEKERIEAESQQLLADAALLAAGYDYQGAIDKLDSFSGDMTKYPDMVTKRSEYATAKEQLVEWKDISSIPNLSFHVLMTDTARAVGDKNYGGQYNRNFVSTGEFSKILQQLYDNGYVLVDYDDIIARNSAVDGSETFFPGTIYLPEGKKPVMITETLVNYFNYMIDSNEDGVADAGGAGFATRLVVDGNGDIKAELVDISGQTLVGDYDLVPILESFIKEHPDFSYKGARATLAVTGKEGVFGYRCNTSYIQNVSQDYYNEQKAGAEKIVQALKDKGYTIACFTYGNISYGNKGANEIKADLQDWTQQITPVVGDDVDILIYAQTSDIDDYSGAKFKLLSDSGFRIFVTNGSAPKTTVENTYVRQTRLMVTGNSMAWYSSQFTGLFDCNAVLDLAGRGGSVPNG